MHIKNQVDFGSREPNSQAIEECRDYIIQNLATDSVIIQNFEVELRGKKQKGVNILGVFSPAQKSRILLVAHYDTRFISDKDPNSIFEPVLGANDGASGVAVLLELAYLVSQTPPSNLGVDFLFVDLEDQGDYGSADSWILGSRHFAKDLLGDEWEKVVVVDMVADKDLNIFKEYNSTKKLTNEIWKYAKEGFVDRFAYSIIDDHIPFLEKGFDAALIIDFDYPYWHTSADIVKNCSAQSLGKVGRTLERFIYQNDMSKAYL